MKCCRLCGVAGGERVPPLPLGWYFQIFLPLFYFFFYNIFIEYPNQTPLSLFLLTFPHILSWKFYPSLWTLMPYGLSTFIWQRGDANTPIVAQLQTQTSQLFSYWATCTLTLWCLFVYLWLVKVVQRFLFEIKLSFVLGQFANYVGQSPSFGSN